MNKLEQAARQALEALEMYNEHGAILRPLKTTHALREALAEQAEQEPVAWMFVNDDGECEEIGYGKDYLKGSEMMADFQPLFAAPVRTKDLTDEEIWAAYDAYSSNLEFARAVIAADRKKNK